MDIINFTPLGETEQFKLCKEKLAEVMGREEYIKYKEKPPTAVLAKFDQAYVRFMYPDLEWVLFETNNYVAGKTQWLYPNVNIQTRLYEANESGEAVGTDLYEPLRNLAKQDPYFKSDVFWGIEQSPKSENKLFPTYFTVKIPINERLQNKSYKIYTDLIFKNTVIIEGFIENNIQVEIPAEEIEAYKKFSNPVLDTNTKTLLEHNLKLSSEDSVIETLSSIWAIDPMEPMKSRKTTTKGAGEKLDIELVIPKGIESEKEPLTMEGFNTVKRDFELEDNHRFMEVFKSDIYEGGQVFIDDFKGPPKVHKVEPKKNDYPITNEMSALLLLKEKYLSEDKETYYFLMDEKSNDLFDFDKIKKQKEHLIWWAQELFKDIPGLTATFSNQKGVLLEIEGPAFILDILAKHPCTRLSKRLPQKS